MRQLNIRVAMAAQNLCRNEAALLFPRPRKNAYSFRQIILSNSYQVLDEEDFPYLPNQKPKTVNNMSSIPAHQKPPTIVPPIQNKQTQKTTHKPRGVNKINKEKEEEKLIQDAIALAQHERIANESTSNNLPMEADLTATPKRVRESDVSPVRKFSRSSSKSEGLDRSDLDETRKTLEEAKKILSKHKASHLVSQTIPPDKPPNEINKENDTNTPKKFFQLPGQ